ncbi:STAS domain-containing protein [Andreprevotia chitinilytica]|uniref:STAS domain-containing protein n=1 Tax=Andreprevotia chitinilytica TaxID=396808 RepID=UPI00055949B6|nr:STAS domain-containing protein [Andreprevotia chitinilytica]
MPISEQTRDGHPLALLMGGFTIFEIAELKDALLHALHMAPDTLEIDLSGVEELDTSGVQVLLLLKQEAARLQKSVHYSRHSPAVLAVIDLLNLAGTLGDPVLMPNGS